MHSQRVKSRRMAVCSWEAVYAYTCHNILDTPAHAIPGCAAKCRME